RAEPGEAAGRRGTVRQRNALDDGAEDHALRERRHHRTQRERRTPERPRTRRLEAELEGDAAEDKRDQHQQHRQVQRRQHQRIGRREGRKQTRTAEHQPGLVAVPDRRRGVHHVVELRAILRERREDAEAEHEAVEQHVHQHAEADHAEPQHRQQVFQAHRLRAHGWPPAPSTVSSGSDIGRAGVFSPPWVSLGGCRTGPTSISLRMYQMPAPKITAYAQAYTTSEYITAAATMFGLTASLVRSRPYTT